MPLYADKIKRNSSIKMRPKIMPQHIPPISIVRVAFVELRLNGHKPWMITIKALMIPSHKPISLGTRYREPAVLGIFCKVLIVRELGGEA